MVVNPTSFWLLIFPYFVYCDLSTILVIIIRFMARNACTYLVVIIVSLFLLLGLWLTIGS